MIIITGGLGFIGSNLVERFNNEGRTDIIIVDNSLTYEKTRKLSTMKYQRILKTWELMDWIKEYHGEIKTVFHLGANTSTVEMDFFKVFPINLDYTVQLFNLCAVYNIPLLYASTAATYGDGSMGYDDDLHPHELLPLNPYGLSKNLIDQHILWSEKRPQVWAGFKFFNVFGYGESHKGQMASMVYHGYNQLKETRTMKLFKSNNPHFPDGGQKRDFIYVDDIVDVLYWFYMNKKNRFSGIYNVGTGKARTFNDLGNAIIHNLPYARMKIHYIDMYPYLKGKYQYFTEAKIDKLRGIGYDREFHSLEEGILKYINKLEHENREHHL